MFGLGVTAHPASAAFNCGGVSVLFNTRHIGSGQWIADWQCGTGSPGRSIPSGVTIDYVQLWYSCGGGPCGTLCTVYPSFSYAECHTYVAGGHTIRAAAHATNGITYLSAIKTT